jgi:hypothetical protein
MRRSAKTDERYLSFVLKYFLSAGQGKIRDLVLAYCHNREVILKGYATKHPQDEPFNFSTYLSFPPRYKVVDYLLTFGFKLYQRTATPLGDVVKLIQETGTDDERYSLQVYYGGFWVAEIETEPL